MRIKLKFKLDKNEISKEYRKAFMSFLKFGLTNLNDSKFYNVFYGDNIKNKEITFSVKLIEPKFEGNIITLGSNILEINISTSNLKKALILNNAFTKMLHKKISLSSENSWQLFSINVYDCKKINTEEILIKMQSPLCIREHKKAESDYYYSIANESFIEKATTILKEQIKNELGEEPEEFIIRKCEARKTVIKHYKQNLECSIGTFILKSDKKTLQHLYDNGMGSRKSAGFGMFEVIN